MYSFKSVLSCCWLPIATTLLFGFSTAPLEAATQSVITDEEALRLDGWKMIFDCEFDSPDDLKKWNILQRSENANAELQCYAPKAATVDNGYLYITGRKEETNYQGKPRHYTSGILNTQKKLDVIYGRFDIRFKVPKGKGFWPAFWLLPTDDSWPPEIDWFEQLGHDPKTIYISNHWGEHYKGFHPSHGPKKFEANNPDFSEDFHTLTGFWLPNQLVTYVDGKKAAVSLDGIPNQKMFMILNLAIGGDWPGNPTEETVFPSEMVVDYVRVYQKDKY